MIVRSAGCAGGRRREHRHRGGPRGAPRHRSTLHLPTASRRPWCGPPSTGSRTGSPRSGTSWPALGWLGLHRSGGPRRAGLRHRRAGVVLEELGRVVAPGPPSHVWVATVLAVTPSSAGDPAVDDASPTSPPAAGTATVAFDGDVATHADGTVSFSATPVLGRRRPTCSLVGTADSALGKGRWWLVDLADARPPPPSTPSTTPGGSPPCRSRAAGRPAARLTTPQVEAVGRGARWPPRRAGSRSWCVDTAAAYAKRPRAVRSADRPVPGA